MRIFHPLGLLACLLISLSVWAQIRIAPAARTAPMHALLVVPGTTDAPIQLQSVEVRAEVSGRLALTSVEMVFFNPNRRILEGELQFPLLDGQRVEGFALDIDGKLREAVPVEKARGQAIFEDILRTRVDPALLEATQGNNFKLRVYPIPAGGTRRIVVRIAETLARNQGRHSFRLPLDYGGRAGALTVDIRVQGKSAPVLVRGDATLLHFAKEGDGFRARAEQRDFSSADLLQFELPTGAVPDIITQRFDGKTYFHASVPVPVHQASRAAPRVVGLVWDSSGSGATRDHGRELALLDGYFRKLGNVEVRLQRIRDRAEPVQIHRVVHGNWQALRRELEATAYDGATNFSAFNPVPGVDTWLLFSDGLGNFSAQPFPVSRTPCFAINAASRSDAGFLRHVAQRSGGEFIDLTLVTPSDALPRLLVGTSRVTGIESDGATQLLTASPLPADGLVEIAGVLTEPVTDLRLTLTHPNGSTQRVSVPLRTAATDSTQAATHWARLAIARLEGEFALHRAEIRRLGKQFRLVTRETSLIVLDRVEDYARHEILPPPELRAAYDLLLRQLAQRRGNERRAHLDGVVRRFEEKQAWWRRDYPKDAPEAGLAHALIHAEPVQMPERLAPEIPKPAIPAPERPASEARLNNRALSGPAAPTMTPAMASREDAPDAKRSIRDTSDAEASSRIAIHLRKWQPDAPYMARLRQSPVADVYRIYLDEKPGYADSTAFFLDAADVLLEKGLPDLAARVLSNLAEMDLENRHILRILGHRLLQAGSVAQAVTVFRQVLALSPDEPQSYRDLGLALAADGQTQAAVDMLHEVVVRPWHGRFPEIELIALADMNALIATSGKPLDTRHIDARLLKNLPLDLRVILTWDADNTDIDLWVTDPHGEKAYYGHGLTRQGGRMSLDFTGGYGPEEFSLKQAIPGKYRIEAQYYGDDRQNVTGPTTLQMKFATRFGTAAAREQIVTLRLKDRREVIHVGDIEVK